LGGEKVTSPDSQVMRRKVWEDVRGNWHGRSEISPEKNRKEGETSEASTSFHQKEGELSDRASRSGNRDPKTSTTPRGLASTLAPDRGKRSLKAGGTQEKGLF